MRVHPYLCAAIAAALLPAAALADNPSDPAMRDAGARARDHALTRQLNLAEIDRVQQRDAGYAEGWRAYREQGAHSAGDQEYTARTRSYQNDNANYARERARYEQEMSDWRRAVTACREGDWSACE